MLLSVVFGCLYCPLLKWCTAWGCFGCLCCPLLPEMCCWRLFVLFIAEEMCCWRLFVLFIAEEMRCWMLFVLFIAEDVLLLVGRYRACWQAVTPGTMTSLKVCTPAIRTSCRLWALTSSGSKGARRWRGSLLPPTVSTTCRWRWRDCTTTAAVWRPTSDPRSSQVRLLKSVTSGEVGVGIKPQDMGVRRPAPLHWYRSAWRWAAVKPFQLEYLCGVTTSDAVSSLGKASWADTEWSLGLSGNQPSDHLDKPDPFTTEAEAHFVCRTSQGHGQSPGEIKRREVSWTLTKKFWVEAFAGPGEIKRREVVLDPQVSPEEIKSMEVNLGWNLDFFCISRCYPTAELRTLSLWLFRTAVGTVIAWYTSCCAMAKRTLP